ncbi:hypothetical protein WJX72_010415 [[Myrmecia] bisecta]|uniref:Glycosyltransferase subfamily 4-like N-terminal domain-containing protein n=1 Tax=[Myrmecia] bisecta TaxID=41462 RepID=A0AAW1PKU7_9CHLO
MGSDAPAKRMQQLRSSTLFWQAVLAGLIVSACLLNIALRSGGRPSQDSLGDRQGVATGQHSFVRRTKVQVCILSADFWGLDAAGGTATAYHLLAEVLAAHSSVSSVTFLGVSKHLLQCQLASNTTIHGSVKFTCLQKRHFLPQVVETYPYEQLSYAVLAWVREHEHQCDIIHAHEWGGVFDPLATWAAHHQLRPGLRLAVEPHGGHQWSTQGMRQRPMDMVSLRIDHHERMVLQLADYVLSPTAYMLASLRQRGWRLPPVQAVLPNVIPAAAIAANERVAKEIWRVAFFGRLEERKGIKMFVEAVSKVNITAHPNFEVFFVGAESQIDMIPSSKWLKKRTKAWPFPTHIMVNRPRIQALEVISQKGMLLVLCSTVDNMPFVVAEAAVMSIPFIVFDVGGVPEMLDPDLHADMLMAEPFQQSLTDTVQRALARGQWNTAVLTEAIATGKEQWENWHVDYSGRVTAFQQWDKQVRPVVARAAQSAKSKLLVVRLPAGGSQKSLELKRAVCRSSQAAQQHKHLLLLPAEYEYRDPIETPLRLEMLAEMAWTRFKHTMVGALTFGAVLPSGKQAYPSSPTWMLYDGTNAKCMENLPVLISTQTFCNEFLAEAQDFRNYQSWVLATMLGQAGINMHTWPEALFNLTSYGTLGASCRLIAVPSSRAISASVAANLYKDAQEMMRNLHVAPWPRPVASLRHDFFREQGHRGWQYLYKTLADGSITPMAWRTQNESGVQTQYWGCSTAYPNMKDFLVHPCAHVTGSVECCGAAKTGAIIRYKSYIANPHAKLILEYEVSPVCGDGLDFTVMLTGAETGDSILLFRQGHELTLDAPPDRQRIQRDINLRPDDTLDFVTHPRGSHDCDGVFIVDIQIWAKEQMM